MRDEVWRMLRSMVREMSGVGQIGRLLSGSADFWGTETDDIWYVIYVMAEKWKSAVVELIWDLEAKPEKKSGTVHDSSETD